MINFTLLQRIHSGQIQVKEILTFSQRQYMPTENQWFNSFSLINIESLGTFQKSLIFFIHDAVYLCSSIDQPISMLEMLTDSDLVLMMAVSSRFSNCIICWLISMCSIHIDYSIKWLWTVDWSVVWGHLPWYYLFSKVDFKI